MINPGWKQKTCTCWMEVWTCYLSLTSWAMLNAIWQLVDTSSGTWNQQSLGARSPCVVSGLVKVRWAFHSRPIYVFPIWTDLSKQLKFTDYYSNAKLLTLNETCHIFKFMFFILRYSPFQIYCIPSPPAYTHKHIFVSILSLQSYPLWKSNKREMCVHCTKKKSFIFIKPLFSLINLATAFYLKLLCISRVKNVPQTCTSKNLKKFGWTNHYWAIKQWISVCGKLISWK